MKSAVATSGQVSSSSSTTFGTVSSLSSSQLQNDDSHDDATVQARADTSAVLDVPSTVSSQASHVLNGSDTSSDDDVATSTNYALQQNDSGDVPCVSSNQASSTSAGSSTETVSTSTERCQPHLLNQQCSWPNHGVVKAVVTNIVVFAYQTASANRLQAWTLQTCVTLACGTCLSVTVREHLLPGSPTRG